MTPRRRLGGPAVDLVVGVLVSAGAVGLVTAFIDLLRPHVPVLSLGALYLFAVLPVAIGWGIGYAIAVAVASMLAFNWFFLPPTHTFSLAESENWLALAVYLVTAVVVSDLAARARRRAAEAEQRERESAVLASVSTALLGGGTAAGDLDRISTRVADLLRVPDAWITLGRGEPPAAGTQAHPLTVGTRHVGALRTVQDTPLPVPVRDRLLPALASLLALAIDREQLQQEALEAETLRRSDAIKTTLLRAVSHDLRSPLTAISAAADALTSRSLVLDDADRATLLETIQVETARLERLVANLLDLSRLQAGAAEPNREPWPVDEVIGMALDELGDEPRVVVDAPDDLPAVLVDAAQIRQALVNVVENALAYSSASSSVHVSARLAGDEVVVRVTDEGPGVSAAEVERIFEPFQRGTTAGGRRGSGLGLSIARGFAEANGARLWAEPSPAGGSFTLALPLAPVTAGVPT